MSNGDKIRELFMKEFKWTDQQIGVYADQGDSETAKKWLIRHETIYTMLQKMEGKGLLD